MKIISKAVRDLDRLLDYLKEKGYDLEEGSHIVLLDHSEVSRLALIKDGRTAAIAIVHYLSPYYRVETKGIKDEDKYLEELLMIKHSGENWRIPVEDVVFVVFDEGLEDLLSSYSDEYPVGDAEALVRHYLSRNPKGKEILRVLLARILDELSGG